MGRRPIAAVLLASSLVTACDDSSDPGAPFLELGVNDLGPAGRLHAFEDGIVAAEVHETAGDLNGDGDVDDSFLEILDIRSGHRSLVPHAETGYRATTGAGFVTFLVSEAGAQGDLNGDGDRNDFVPHVQDARGGALRNLGFASFSAPIQQGALVAFAPGEQPGLDLNGDGDFGDFVAQVYEADRRQRTWLSAAANGDTIQIHGRRVFYLDDETSTVRVYDADTGQLRSIPHSIDGMWVQGSLLATLVPEWENTGGDLNGNGSTSDLFVELHDLDTGAVRVTEGNDCWVLALDQELAVVALDDYTSVEVRVYDRFSDTLSEPLGLGVGPPSFSVSSRQVSDRRYAYLVSEHETGTDLNGDGELWDEVLHLFDARTGLARNTERAAFARPQIDAERVVFLGLPKPTDRKRTSLHVLDVHTGVVSDLGVMASVFRLVDGRVLVMTPEEWQGADLDGDHELTHTVLQVHDLASGETLSTGLTRGEYFDDEVEPVVLDGDVLALVVDERLIAVRLR